MKLAPDDTAPRIRVFRVLLRGECGWYEDGSLTLQPNESLRTERARIETCENRPCRLRPTIAD